MAVNSGHSVILRSFQLRGAGLFDEFYSNLLAHTVICCQRPVFLMFVRDLPFYFVLS